MRLQKANGVSRRNIQRADSSQKTKWIEVRNGRRPQDFLQGGQEECAEKRLIERSLSELRAASEDKVTLSLQAVGRE